MEYFPNALMEERVVGNNQNQNILEYFFSIEDPLSEEMDINMTVKGFGDILPVLYTKKCQSIYLNFCQ